MGQAQHRGVGGFTQGAWKSWKKHGKACIATRPRGRGGRQLAGSSPTLSQARLHLGVDASLSSVCKGSLCTRAPVQSRARKGRDAPSCVFHLPIFPIWAGHLTICGDARGALAFSHQASPAPRSQTRGTLCIWRLCRACALEIFFLTPISGVVACPGTPPLLAGPSPVIRLRDSNQYQGNAAAMVDVAAPAVAAIATTSTETSHAAGTGLERINDPRPGVRFFKGNCHQQ